MCFMIAEPELPMQNKTDIKAAHSTNKFHYTDLKFGNFDAEMSLLQTFFGKAQQ